MKTILQKLIQDFAISRMKLLLSVIATAMATWGIVTVSFTFLLSERDFKINYEGALPSDFTLVISNYNDSIQNVIVQEKSIASVERREVLTGQVQNKNGIWMPMVLFGLESLDQQKLDKIILVEKFNTGSLFIEQNAAGFLYKLDEDVNIKLGKNKSLLHLQSAGLVHDPLQAPAQMEQIFYAYASLASLDSLLKESTARLIVRVVESERNYTSIKKIADDLSVTLAQRGSSVLEMEIREPGKHIHQPIIDGVAFLQISFGSVLLFLGITLFAMILLTWLIPQIPDIGIMKSLGATQQEIYKAYVIIILVIASLGLLLGFPSGLYTAAKFNGFIAMVQNFESVTAYFPFHYYALVALISILPPLVVGLIPIRQITGAPVRQALTTMFYTEPGKLVKLLVNAKITARLKYSINNVFRNGFRTYLLLILLCLGLSLYFTGSSLSHSFNVDLSDYFKSTPYQITVNLREVQQANINLLANTKEIKSLAPVLQTNITYQFRLKNHQALLTIYPTDYEMKETLFLSGAENSSCHDCIFVHPQMVREDFKDVKVGEEIKLWLNDSTEQKVKYGGVMRDVFPGRKEMIFWFTDAPLIRYNKLAIELKNPEQLKQGIQAVEKTLNDNKIKFRNIVDTNSSKTSLINHFQPTYLIVQALGIFTVVLSLLGMLIVISLTLKERTAEMGVIKALGGSASAISKLLVMEFLSITLLSMLLALPLAKVLSEILCGVYGEMIRGFAITQHTDYLLLIIFIILVISLQSIAVMWFANVKIKKTSLELINTLS